MEEKMNLVKNPVQRNLIMMTAQGDSADAGISSVLLKTFVDAPAISSAQITDVINDISL